MTFTAACIQLNSGDDVGENIARIAPLVDDAAGRGAQLICLPENAFSMLPHGGGTSSLTPSAGVSSLTPPASVSSLTPPASVSSLTPPAGGGTQGGGSQGNNARISTSPPLTPPQAGGNTVDVHAGGNTANVYAVGNYDMDTHPGLIWAKEAARKHHIWLLVGSVAVAQDAPLPLRERTDFVGESTPSNAKGKARLQNRGEGNMKPCSPLTRFSKLVTLAKKNLPLPQGEREERPGGRVFNRSILIDDAGGVAAVYDKIHLFDAEAGDGHPYRESARYLPGDRAVVADTPRGKLGLSVCYDLRFPQLYRALAQSGAEILAVPSAFTHVTGTAHWHVLLRARAIETGCFVLASAQCGEHPGGRRTFGHALMIDPWGRILAEASESEPGVILAEIDIAQVSAARRRIPSLKHDRVFSQD